MSELTKRDLDHALKGVATREDLKSLATKKDLDKLASTVGGLSGTVDRLSGTVDRTAIMVTNLVDGLKHLPLRLQKIEDTLEGHTVTLDAISKQLNDIATDRAALVLRLERYDKFMKIVADKLNLDLHSLLD